VTFRNPILGAGGSTLLRPAIQSPNYLTGSTGWAIKRDGSAEFNNVVIRGGTVVSGLALYYDGTPASGNLIMSVSATAGTDAFGNDYPAGLMVQDSSGRRSQLDSLGTIRITDLTQWDNGASLSVQAPLSAFGLSTILQSATNDSPPGDAAAALVLDPGTAGTNGTAQFTSPGTGVEVDLDVSGNLTAKNIQVGTTVFAMVAVTQMDVAVTFPQAFDTVPRIAATLRGSVAGSTALIVKSFNVTTTGMTLRVTDVGGVARTLTINADWHAIA